MFEKQHNDPKQSGNKHTKSGGARLQTKAVSHEVPLLLQNSIGNQAVGRILAARQNAAGEQATPVTQQTQRAIDAQRAGGVPLQGELLGEMETLLGTQIDGVRLHTGATVDELALGLGARAFTQGHDVFLRSDRDPDTDEGRASLAHELAHVAQGPTAVGTVFREADPAHEPPGASAEGAEHAGEHHALAGMAFEREFSLESEPVEYGPVQVSAACTAKLAGELKHGEGATLKISGKGTEHFDEGAVEQEFKNRYGSVKVGGSAEPGKAGALQVGFATETYEIGISAHADLRKPFEISFEIPVHQTQFKFGEWEFKGEIKGAVKISIGPNWARVAQYAAEETVAELTGGAAEAGEGITGVALGTGAEGVVFAAGSAFVVIGGIAFIGLTLYEAGKAMEEGKKRAIRLEYCNGYAYMLANLTSEHPKSQGALDKRSFDEYFDLNWADTLARAEKAYVDADSPKERMDAQSDARDAGRARALQQAMAYVAERGPETWADVRRKHQEEYGELEMKRREAYIRHLYHAPEDGPPPIVPIP